MGILHLGQLKHYVTPIEQGVRTNLVLWLRYVLDQSGFFFGCFKQMQKSGVFIFLITVTLLMCLRSSAVRNKVCPMCWDSPEIVATKCMDDGFRP